MAADVASTDWYAEDSASPCTVVKPAGLAAGDRLVFLLSQDSGVLADLAPTPPTGWTVLSANVDIASQRVKGWYYDSVGSDPASWDFPYNSGASVAGPCIRITSADPATAPVVATGSTASNGSTMDSPSVTPTGTDDLLIVTYSNQGGGTALVETDPSGTTDLGQGQVAGNFQCMAAAKQQLASGSATGVRTWTGLVPTGGAAGTFSIAIKSAAASAGSASPQMVLPPWLMLELVGAAALSYYTSGPITPDALSAQPLVINPGYSLPLPVAQLFSSPSRAAATPSALVVTPPWTPVYIPPVRVTTNYPLGNPAVGSPQPLIITPPPWRIATQAQLFTNPAAPEISTVSTPNAVVAGPPFAWPLTPVNYISASQPLGNPAVPTPQPLVITTAWLAKVSGAIISGNPVAPTVVSSTTPNALIVTPPAPAPLVPLVRLFAGSPTTFSAQPLLVTSPYVRQPVPGARIFANPLIPPAQRTFSQILVVSKPWVPDPGGVRIRSGYMLPPGVICEIPRPSTGAVTRPSTGTVAFAGGIVTRPSTGTVARPDTGIAEDPC